MLAKTKQQRTATTDSEAAATTAEGAASTAPLSSALSSSSSAAAPPLSELEPSESAHYIFEDDDDDNNSESFLLTTANDSDDDVLFALLGATTMRYPSRAVAASAVEDKEESSSESSLVQQQQQQQYPISMATTAATKALNKNLESNLVEETKTVTDTSRPGVVAAASSEEDDYEEEEEEKEEEEEEEGNDGKERAPRRKTKAGLLGRFKPSSSRRSRLFGSKQQQPQQQQSQQTEITESAVDERNHNFDDWELQAAPRSLLTQQGSLRLSRSGVETAGTATSGNPSITSSVVSAILKEQRKHEKATVAAVCQDGLDGRWTADAVATALQLGDDAEQLLGSLRGRSGAVLMGEDDDDGEAAQKSQHDKPHLAGVPDLHVAEDVWIPHYEEYVVKMVDAFGRFLGKSGAPPGQETPWN